MSAISSTLRNYSQNVDFFWIDPTQSFLTDTKEICKKQVPKIPLVCDLQAEMDAFEESIGAAQPKLRDSEEQRPLLNVPPHEIVPDPKSDEKRNVDSMPHPENTLADETHVDGDEKHQTSQLNPLDPEKPIKADVHKLVAANLEKEDKELENLNKNLIDIIGNFMSKVQGSGDSSSQALGTSGDSIDPSNTATDSVPKPIDVLDSSVTCPIEEYDDYHHLDPQDRPHYTNQSGVPEPQFIEYVTSAGATEALTDVPLTGSTHSSFAQYPSQYYSQIPGQSADASLYQQAFDPQGVPIYPYPGQVPPSVLPYSEQGTALVDPYSGQYVFNTTLPGYDVEADADHSPDHYCDNEEPSSAPHVGPCTPEPQLNIETVKKPYMTAEEIRLHRKEYFRKKREEELKCALSGNPDPAPQPSSTIDKQHRSEPSNVAQSKVKPDHGRKDQKPTSSKSNQPKGPSSRFMIPKRNDKSKEVKESELNPTNPFSPNPKFFMKNKSSASSTSEIKTKPDSNKLDKHFYNELKSKYEFKSKTHGSPICDNSISSTTDKDSPNPSKKKMLSSKFKESHKDNRYPKNVIDSQKLQKKKGVSSATSARKMLSSDEDDSVENKPKLDQKIHDKLLSDGSKSSSMSKSNSSHLKDFTNAIERYPFVIDDLSRKAIACKCFVKLVNIFWNEKNSMTIDEMNEKLPRLVEKELDLLKKNRTSDELANLGEGLLDLSSSGQEPDHPDSTLGKEREIVIESKLDQEVDDVTKPVDDVAENLLPHADIGEAQKHEKHIAGSLEKEGKTSSVSDTSNASEGKDHIPTDAEEKLKTSDDQEIQETSLKQIPKSTEEGISEASRTEDSCPIVDEKTTIKETPTILEDDALVKGNVLDTFQKEEKIPDCIDSTSKSKIEKKVEPHNEYKKECLESTSKSTIEREDAKEELHRECSKESLSDSQHQKKRKRKDSLENKEKDAKEEPHRECSKESLSDSQHQKKRKRKYSLENAEEDEKEELHKQSLSDSQHQKKRKIKGYLENAEQKKRKTSSGSIIDSSSDAREELTRKDLDEVDTSLGNEEVSDGFEADDHVFDHDDSDNEEKMSEKSCSNENLDKSNVGENLNNSSKIEEKSSKIEEENSKVQEPGIPEKDLEELCVSENYKKDNADNKKETRASEISIEVETGDNKESSQSNVNMINNGKTEKIPLSTNESSDKTVNYSTMAVNKIERSKDITISQDEKPSMNCSVKVIDIFWKEKKSLSHEEFQTILPTLIEDIIRKLKISTKVKKIEKKNENKKKKKDDDDEYKDKSYAPSFLTKGQKKFYEKEDVKTHYKFKDHKKKMGKEPSENLRKKSGLSREFISSSSNDSDDDIIKRKSVDSGKVSISHVKQNLDKLIHKKEKKKRKKTSKERSRLLSGIRSESEDETPPLEKPIESDSSSDDVHISSKSKKASKLERRENKKKKREKRKEKKKKDDQFSEKECATDKEKALGNEDKNDGKRQDSTSSSHSKKKKKKTEKSDQLSKKKKKISSSNPNSDDEGGVEISEKHDTLHEHTDSEEKSAFKSRNKNDHDRKRQDSKSSSHSKKKKQKTDKSDQFSKENFKIPASNPNSGDEKADSTIQNLCNQETDKNIVEEILSIEERTQIFSDSEEECTNTESPKILNAISDKNKNADSIKDTVSNIIDSLSIECSPKKKLADIDKVSYEAESGDQKSTGENPLETSSSSGPGISSCVVQVNPNPINAKDETTPAVQNKTMDVDNFLDVTDNKVSSSLMEETSQDDKVLHASESSVKTYSETSSESGKPQLPSSGDVAFSDDVGSSSVKPCDKPSSASEEPQFPPSEGVKPSSEPSYESEKPQLPSSGDVGSSSVKPCDDSISASEEPQLLSSDDVGSSSVKPCDKPSSASEEPQFPPSEGVKPSSEPSYESEKPQLPSSGDVGSSSVKPCDDSISALEEPQLLSSDDVGSSSVKPCDKPSSASKEPQFPPTEGVKPCSEPSYESEKPQLPSSGDVGSSSVKPCDDLISASEEPQLPSSGAVSSSSVEPCDVPCSDRLPEGSESNDSSSETHNTLPTKLISVEDKTKTKDSSIPENSTCPKNFDVLSLVPKSDDQHLASENVPVSSSGIIVADTDTKDSKDQSSHSETLNDNVASAHLQLIDEESSLSNSIGLEGIEKRRAPEEVQNDLAELDKKMEEIEKIVHNQLESAPPILSAEQPSTNSEEIETNSSNCFECILCKNTFSTDCAAHNYSEKVSAFCKPCYDNLYKERFDSWRKSLE